MHLNESVVGVYIHMYYMQAWGSLHTSQISHLLLYPSLWLLLSGLSSQFFAITSYTICLYCQQWSAISLSNGYKIL